ncbi:MAG: DUF6492 family protein [Nodosilinea sp.]
MTFGLITPSYAPDFERCKLLCETREQFLPSSVMHYIVVDKRDVSLFKALSNRRTEILTVEDILPWWIQRIPFANQGWISLKTLPIRNWILQQLVKLSMAQVISEDVLGFVDSDVAFVRPFDPQNFVRMNQVRFYREPNSIPPQWSNFQKWYRTASNLLNTPQVSYPAPNFIGDLITWRRDVVLKLHSHIEAQSGRSWLETLAGTLHWSEYILYGMFVEYVLKDTSGHYYDEKYPGLQYFSTEDMSTQDILEFLAGIEPHHVTVMISAKAKIPVERYKGLLAEVDSPGVRRHAQHRTIA